MKYLKFFESFEDIHKLCAKFKIENYTINSEGRVDVDGNVVLGGPFFYIKEGIKLYDIPIDFGKVSGNFNLPDNKIISLLGSPLFVGGIFDLSSNMLTSLEFCPEYIGKDFCVSVNKLREIKHFPKIVEDIVDLRHNGLRNIQIDFIPKLYGNAVRNVVRLEFNPIYPIFELWGEDFISFIQDLYDYDFIRENGTAIDTIRFGDALSMRTHWKFDRLPSLKYYRYINFS